ncbi:hypothetical protein TrVGV298_009037 [Trichoderma virens]|nr:hypothetical protein TrVGV298_009037 [Trichoderma virens]
MAAAFAKDLLRRLVHAQVMAGKNANELLLGIHNQLDTLTHTTKKVSYKLDLAKLSIAHGAELDSYATQHADECLPGTRVEILHRVTEWATSLRGKCIFWLSGMAGTGKSTISRTLAKDFEKKKAIIHLLPQVQASGFIRIRVFITSRPELPIRLGFEDIEGDYQDLVLHCIPRADIERDISLSCIISLMSFENTDRLYSKYGEDKRREHFEEVRKVVSVIVLLQNPLSMLSLSKLTGIPTRTIKSKLNSLHSVLNIPIDETTPVRLLHLSFRDFLLDHGTRKKTALWIDEKETHKKLTIQCIDQMLEGLKENICQLSDYDTEPGEIDPDTIAQCIPPELQYSCRYWVYHLERSQNPATLINDALLFLQKRLLHWIEAMSWLDFIPDVISAIKSLQSVAEDGRNSDVTELLDDARRFILKFSYIIGSAPRQLYISGLVFSPTGSILRKLFFKEKPDWISVSGNIENSWGKQIQTLEGHEGRLESIAFSPNGLLLTSSAKDKTVKVWNLATGTLRQTFTGYSNPVICMAFTSDSQVLVSVSQDITIKLWDVTTGVLQQTIKNKYSTFSMVAAISPDGRWVASRSTDSSIVIFDRALGTWNYTSSKPSEMTSPLAFSANGLLLAAASGADIIIWDTITCTLRQTLQDHYEREIVDSVAFSPDGQTLASSHNGSEVKLWDVINGTTKYHFTNRLVGNTVAFSPDSQLLAVGHSIGMIIWNISTGQIHRKISKPARIIAFSSDGKMLPSNFGRTIELWDLTVECLEQFTPSQLTKDIEFFLDGQMAISTCCVFPEFYDNSERVDVWKPIEGTRLKSLGDYNPGRGYMCGNGFIAVSTDCQLLAYLSDFGRSVKIWDITTGIQWSICMISEASGAYKKIVFTPDSQQLVTGNRVGISFWVHAGEGDGCWVSQRTLEYKGDGVESISFSPDSRLLSICFFTRLEDEATPYRFAVDIWDWTTGLLVQTLETCRRQLTSVAFSTNGQLLAREKWTGAMDCENYMEYGPIIEPWDLSTGKLHPNLAVEGHYDYRGGVVTSLPPISDLKFHALYSRYAETKKITLSQEQWVCFQGRKVLWLPPRYRPTCYAANDDILAFVDGEGEVTFVKFSFST